MHHRKHRAKNARAGCLLCKPHKANGNSGMKKKEVCKTGFGVIKGIAKQDQDLQEQSGYVE